MSEMTDFRRFGKYICSITGEVCDNAEIWLLDNDPEIGIIPELWDEKFCPYDSFGYRAYTPRGYNPVDGFEEPAGGICTYLSFKEYDAINIERV